METRLLVLLSNSLAFKKRKKSYGNARLDNRQESSWRLASVHHSDALTSELLFIYSRVPRTASIWKLLSDDQKRKSKFYNKINNKFVIAIAVA